jgi:hypothetical protein
VSPVEIPGGQPIYFNSGGQLKFYGHVIAAFIALVDDFFYVFLQDYTDNKLYLKEIGHVRRCFKLFIFTLIQPSDLS